MPEVTFDQTPVLVAVRDIDFTSTSVTHHIQWECPFCALTHRAAVSPEAVYSFVVTALAHCRDAVRHYVVSTEVPRADV